jgi:trimeric autotransporter adhesin
LSNQKQVLMYKNYFKLFSAAFALMLSSIAGAQTISISSSSSDTICSGTSVTFTAAATGGSHYKWLVNSIAVGTDATTYTTTTLAEGDVVNCELLASAGGSVLALSGPKVMTVYTIPTVSAIAGSTLICRGAVASYMDTITGGTWSLSNARLASVSGSGNVTPFNTGIDTLTYTISNMCGTASASVAITIGTTPFIGPVTGPGSICMGNTATYTDSPAVGTWSLSNSTVASITTAGVVTALATGSDTISYSASNACGTDTRSRTLTVVTPVTAQPITGTSTVCQGDTVHLNNPVAGGTWHSDNNMVANAVGGGGGGRVEVIHGNMPGMVNIVDVVGNACGSDSSSFSITVNPLPLVTPIAGRDSLCPGMSEMLSEYNTGGTWSSGNTAVATVDASGNVSGIAAGTTMITYSATNSCGTVSQSISISIYCPYNVGVAQVSENKGVTIYPNPATDNIIIAGINPSRVQLTDIYGKTVRNIANANTLSVSGLLAGMYFITIFDTNGSAVVNQKIVKQ